MSAAAYPPLDAADQANLEQARQWVKGFFTDHADEKYEPVEGKLRVLDAILSNEWTEPSETAKLEALGVALGDALAQKLMLEWVLVDDEDGCTPALSWPGTSALCYPLTMIRKRVERGEKVDIDDLFDGVCRTLSDAVFTGKWV